MGKKGGAIRYNRETKTPKIQPRPAKFTEKDMDDEIDAFHKQRDIIPLDLDDDMESSDEDNVHSVYDIKGSDEDEDEDEESYGYKDDKFTKKMAKQQQYMRQKTGGVKDETQDDVDEDEEEKGTLRWGLRTPYGGDNADIDDLDSDDDDVVLEENEAMRLRKEFLESYSAEDFVNDHEENASDAENLEDVPSKSRSKHQPGKGAEYDTSIAYAEKDLDALSKEEQMEVVYSSAPEVVGLLSELKDTLNQLDKVNPLISMVKKRNNNSKEGIHYLDTKKSLLLAYCQAISFYLLLKAEGLSVHDHPVLARLVELKTLLEKMKQIDDKLPSKLEEILEQEDNPESESESDLIKENASLTSETVSKDIMQSPVSVITNGKTLATNENGFSKENGPKEAKRKRQVSSKSMEMLKLREKYEEKLKQKGGFNSVTSNSNRSQKFPSQPPNGQLETIYDFGDEVIDNESSKSNLANGRVTTLPKLISTKPKSKVISGDEDLPMRDDIGEKRRKYEQRILGNVGVESDDENEGRLRKGKNVKSMDVDVEEKDETDDDDDDDDGEDEFYKNAKRRRDAKLSEKAEIYSRKPNVPHLADEDIADGKRGINRQIEKNRGLTRYRKKQNPRTEYKKSYEKQMRNRTGQVRNMKNQKGPYGGETTGINANISRSTRFN